MELEVLWHFDEILFDIFILVSSLGSSSYYRQFPEDLICIHARDKLKVSRLFSTEMSNRHRCIHLLLEWSEHNVMKLTLGKNSCYHPRR